MRLLEMQRRTLQYSTISARIIVKDDHDGSTGHALIIDVGEIITTLLGSYPKPRYGLARMPVFLNALTTDLGLLNTLESLISVFEHLLF